MKRIALILAGGAGTRLRPLSSDENPKQFLPIFDGGRSLLQMTYARARAAAEAVYVSTFSAYAEKCRAQAPEAVIITEPERRNNAAAIALSCFEIESREGDCAIAALPSDHYIADEATFGRVLEHAFSYAEGNDALVTIGIAPSKPHTGYGYLRLEEEIEPGVNRVGRFTEKPSADVAAQFLAAGNYAWNAGIFVWRASVFRRALTKAAPEIAGVTWDNYAAMPSVSIDYALMEKATNVVAIRGDFGWSDVGSFEALRELGVDVDQLLK